MTAGSLSQRAQIAEMSTWQQFQVQVRVLQNCTRVPVPSMHSQGESQGRIAQREHGKEPQVNSK